MNSSKEILSLFEADEQNFLGWLVTGDETWIHHYDPETKQQSMEWRHKNSPPPVKFKVQPSAGKIMSTIFWDAEGIIMIDYLEDRKTINGQYYADLLVRLREKIN